MIQFQGKIKLNKERVYESFEIYLQQLCDVSPSCWEPKMKKEKSGCISDTGLRNWETKIYISHW